ncbi:MAG TPA: glycine betaine ABC transporter substrate-binding protein [Rhizomicrobium sp.]|nr:glycine betaine ABC transporter substrate-binding protein [Rhizomicrobium sp.]
MDAQIASAWAVLPDYLGQHVLLSVTALAIGLFVGLSLAIIGVWSPRLRWFLLTATGLIQTIPGLALLALFYPLLLALSALTEHLFGVTFSALGFLPSLLALALYSILPILRNTVTGILGVDDAVREAARGVGMTPAQRLFKVELPLAMPVIMAGIRTAAVWVIGTATLSTPIGQTSLGNYIFTGLQTQNWVFVVFGCVAAVVLALVVDQCLALIERGFARRSTVLKLLGAIGLGAVLVASLLAGPARGGSHYVIGGKAFVEQYILAALIDQRLDDAGMTATHRVGLGSTVIFDALAANEIDAYVDYSGTIWANFMHRRETASHKTVLKEVGAWLKRTRGITMLGPLGFDNAYALVMRRDQAERLNIRSIADLAPYAGRLSIAGDYEFFARPEWKALKNAYGLNFRETREMQSTFMYRAVADGAIDVISGYTSDGQIAQYDLVVLDDPKQSLPPYDAILLLSPRRAEDTKFRRALEPLIGRISTERMRQANLSVSRVADQRTPEQAAEELWRDIAAK